MTEITSETFKNLADWDYHYDVTEVGYPMRANLVYTPLINPERTILCMDFTRDFNFHDKPQENKLWTEEMMVERFNREVKFIELAEKAGIPVLKVLEIDHSARRIFVEWNDTDFYMQGRNSGGFDKVLPDWKTQWLDIMEKMWRAGMYKISLHPNSFIAINGKLHAFNWFFTFENTEPDTTLRTYLPQISTERFEKLEPFLKQFEVTLDNPLSYRKMQELALNVFVSNYPKDLLDEAINLLRFIEKNPS